jgi:hypothetical protein
VNIGVGHKKYNPEASPAVIYPSRGFALTSARIWHEALTMSKKLLGLGWQDAGEKSGSEFTSLNGHHYSPVTTR